jgi:hypothetical protein
MVPQNEKPLATTEAAAQGLPGMSHGDTSRSRPVDDTSASPPSALQQLPETFGRYRILKKLGQGGMGAVYLAHDMQLDRQVALKVPRFSAEEGPQAIERFLREARAAATIQHPNLCPVHDVGQIEGIHYMTMAYIEGHLLSEYIRPGKPAPQRQSAAVVRKMALALQEAHARGIVPRLEAHECDAEPARRADHHGFRPGPSGSWRGGRADAGRLGAGHSGLHGARAGAWR